MQNTMNQILNLCKRVNVFFQTITHYTYYIVYVHLHIYIIYIYVYNIELQQVTSKKSVNDVIYIHLQNRFSFTN